jgi:hypothetical protein
MSLIHSLRTVFQRAPKVGARKDDPMPEPTPQPPATPDVTAHLTALADAVRRLAESQKTLVENLKPAPAAAPTPPAPSPEISGDPSGGASPGALAAVDYSKLSPLQQITLGLRDAARATPRAGAD